MSLSYGFCLDGDETTYNSAQFSNAFSAVFGDGITPYGSKFALTLNGFTATLSSGFSLAAGRFLKNGEPLPLSVPLPDKNRDRIDAIAVSVDCEEKKADLKVLVNIDADNIRENISVLRNSNSYSLLLYLAHVRRGATSISVEDITDVRADKTLCGYILPISEISEAALYAYSFLSNGLDQKAQQFSDRIDSILQEADAEIAALDQRAIDAGGKAAIGDLSTSLVLPGPANEWLLCNGSAVPTQYPELSEILNGVLPSIQQTDGRFKTYIYAGKPKEGVT